MPVAKNTGLLVNARLKITKQKKQTNSEAMAEFRQLQKKRIPCWLRGEKLSLEDDFKISRLIARFNPYNK